MVIEIPELHPNQQSILDNQSRFRVVMCGRRFGKSELAQIEMIYEGIKGNAIGYITPTYQLAKTFFAKLAKILPFENNKSDLIINFPNGGSIRFFTGERLDNLRGRKFHFVVVDEASFIPDLEKAKVIANVAQTIINSASVENQYLKIVGGSQGSGFIEEGRMENIKSIGEKN